MMRRMAALSAALALGSLLMACGGDSNSNASNTANTARSNANGVGRQGMIDTNANIPANAGARSVPSDTGVLVDNNGNANTRGVATMNR